MKDLRGNVIDSVLARLIDTVTQDVIDAVYDALIIVLDTVELTERCTEVAIVDDSPDKALRRFIATKRIEGASEKTLERIYFCRECQYCG